jgi:hypothetical protein
VRYAGGHAALQEVVSGERRAVVVAVHDVASKPCQYGCGVGGFDASGDGGQAQGVRQVDDRVHNRCCGVFGGTCSG